MKKITWTIVGLVTTLIALPLILKKDLKFTGREYDGESLTANLFQTPVTFTDVDGKLVDGYAVRYYPGTEQLYSKASFKDGVMHGPFLSYWDNGTRYKNMRTWDRDGNRLKGSGDEQIAQIRSMDKQLGNDMDELEKIKVEFIQ